jgi:hypothetical protein
MFHVKHIVFSRDILLSDKERLKFEGFWDDYDSSGEGGGLCCHS